ncbi:hypothetical protein Peur_026463 [Populus x canadensis]
MLLLLIIYLFILNMFMDFSIISWNVCGGTNKIRKRHYKELARRYRPSLFVWLEMHVNFLNITPLNSFIDELLPSWKVKYNIGYTLVAISKAQGYAGGIWIISSISYVSLSTLDITRQCVTIQVSMGSSSWFLSAVYISPIPGVQLQLQLWDYLNTIKLKVQGL